MISDDDVITVTPPKPHSKKQAMLQQAFLMPGIREVWVAAGTKFGKSIGLSSGFACASVLRPNATWRWVAPIYEQARIGMNYCKSILPHDPDLANVVQARMEIELPSINAMLKFRHAQDANSLEGQGIAGDVFDECAKIKREAYDAAKTTRTVTQGIFVGASTPLGKNWFYTKCMEAKDEMAWALRNGKQPTRIFLHAPSTDNPMVTAEVVAEAKRDMPDRLFRQYYLAEFIDDGTVFSRFRDCVFGPELPGYGEHQAWFDEEAKGRQVVLGADWAKTVDYTTFFAIDYEHRRVVGYERFHKRPYTEAVKRLGRFGQRFADVSVCMHDKTGVGVAIDEMCQHLPFPCVGVTFTNRSKTDMVNSLISRFELVDLAIPNWPTLLKELDAFEVNTNSLGIMKYGAPDGQHDDTVCALMLANAALAEYGEGNMDVSSVGSGKDDKDGKTEAKSAIEQFYLDLAEDAEDD